MVYLCQGMTLRLSTIHTVYFEDLTFELLHILLLTLLSIFYQKNFHLSFSYLQNISSLILPFRTKEFIKTMPTFYLPDG